MRVAFAIVVTALAGCRGVLGIDEARLFDGPQPDQAALADASPCFGGGLVTVCLATLPTQPRVLPPSTIDTATMCDQIVAVPGLDVCVLAGTSITSSSGTLQAIGPRPLVLVSTSTITIDGTLSVSSRRTGAIGAGAMGVTCAPPAGPGENDPAGAGGGGGGSFAGAGGVGGQGNVDGPTPSSGGSQAGNDQIGFRGGCAGGRGGSGGPAGALGGAGGGVVYLIASQSIVVNGAVTANGAGGEGGAGSDGGGAGGGGGGLVGFDAPMIDVPGAVTANGGGGGEGSGNAGGLGGADGDATDMPARGGGNIAVNGGDGGDGGAGTTAAMPGASAVGGGGGGGGGVGYIYVRSSAVVFTGVASPPPTIVP